MAFVTADRVRELSTTSGTGPMFLGGPVAGYQSFADGVGVGNSTFYAISAPNGAAWEVGVGTVAVGSLSRDTVLSSSNGGAKVNFPAGTKDVFATFAGAGAVVGVGTTIQAPVGTRLPVANGGTGVATVEAEVSRLAEASNISEIGEAIDAVTNTELQTALGDKEDEITAGTTSQYWRGDKTWQDFDTSVRTAELTGLSTASPADVEETDDVLTAAGKLQARVTKLDLYKAPRWPDFPPAFDQRFGYNGEPLDPRITHTRPGKSWRIVNGVLREYDVNEPVLTPEGWSLRPAETNLVWPSVPASGTWGAINATWGDTVEAAGYTLRRVNVGAAGTGAAKYITRTNMSAAAGEIVLLALVVLPNAGNSTLGLSFTGYGAWEGGGGAAADFDLLAGTSSWVGGPGVAKGMQQLEDGAWLCWTVGKKKSDTSDTSLSPAITVWPTGTASSGTEHLHVGGVHVVKGFTAPIPYIPTTDSAVTRPADNAPIQGDAFAEVFNPVEGAIVVDVIPQVELAPSANKYMWLVGTETPLNYFGVYVGAGSNQLRLRRQGGGQSAVSPILDANYAPGKRYKVCVAWEGPDLTVVLDGAKVADIAYGFALDSSDRLILGSGLLVINEAAVTHRRLTIFNRRPSDAQMEALTS